jgi:isoaspartyl peptidase/L-asparaginase-like protein (Ntn-hydrolase superfamily)
VTAPRELLDQLDALHALGTTGPWAVDGALGPVIGAAILPPQGVSEVPVVAVDAGVIREADAALIVAAVNALPQLTAAIRAVLELADLFDENWEVVLVDHDDDCVGAAIRAAIAAALAPADTTGGAR